MSYIKILIHCVWCTKRKIPFLTKNYKNILIDHIKSNAKEKGIYIDTINGDKNHIHCLISLGLEQNISKVMQLIKGESSFWINKSKIIKSKFEWADEYFAVSVSITHLKKVREYINNQEIHHHRRTWEEEYNNFITKYGFKKITG